MLNIILWSNMVSVVCHLFAIGFMYHWGNYASTDCNVSFHELDHCEYTKEASSLWKRLKCCTSSVSNIICITAQF